MFQNIFQISLSLIIGILVGWNFHIFYISLEPTISIKNNKTIDKNTTKTVIISKNIKNKNIKDKKIDNNLSNQLKFEKLLKNGDFDNAISLYMDGDEEEIKKYKLILKVYFYDNATKNPKKIIEEMLTYIELEPEAYNIKIHLAKIYREQKEFQKALNLLFEIKETQNSKIVENDLNITIDKYIKHLKNSKNFKKLISFLEELINRDENSQNYTIRLAEIYTQLNKYEESKRVLEEIDENSIYSNKAKNILKKIEKKEKELQHYRYIIPINRVGSQYSINISINNTPLTLLLDTGATYTFIDEEKLPSLTLGKEILLNTAGGEITAHFANVETLNIGELQLNNFPITVAPFKEDFADGLLGMDFFEKFDFKINQNIGLLYLSEK